ncbi:hypothetical protein H6F89_29360 [Cyanobacteria bacterium FACHB-63]|nr:hypothetical protein [Cyanobacteria bacterium FACHB-63]
MAKHSLRSYVLLILVFLVSQLAIACTSSAIAQGDLKWTYLSQSSIPKLQTQLQQGYQQSGVPVDVGRMRVLKIRRSGQEKALYLIDSRVALEPNRTHLNPRCGKAGCEFEGYIQTNDRYKRVLAVYLNPNPPQGKPLIEPTATLQNGLPCLKFNQRDLKRNQIEVVRWCYDGQQYRFVDAEVQKP